MCEGPSTTGISESRVNEAINHARAKYPFDKLEPKTVLRLALAVRAKRAATKSADVIELRRKAIAGIGTPIQSTRFLAYMVALDYVERLEDNRARSKVLAVSPEGPMTLRDVFQHIRTGSEFEVPTTH